ncbi:MAG: multidrug efflux SMR transporter [Pseudomonadota bacterium]
MSGWTWLTLAIFLEILATTCLKLSDGFAKPVWGVASIALYSICFVALSPALKALPVGTVYAIWSGVGIVAIALIGALFFKEQLALMQYGFILLILIGAIGLRATTS